MTKSARALRGFLSEMNWSALKLAHESGVHFSTIYKVSNGQRKSFSASAADKIHRVNPEKLPLRALLGLD